MRLVIAIRSRISTARSRTTRRRSSSCGFGGRTIEHTRGSPRRHASNVRSSVSPSMPSLLPRRRRRGTATEAASTTWLSMPFASSSRCSQKPSSPASSIATTRTGPPTCSSACRRRRPRSASSAATSPAATMCFDIFSLPGSSEVTSHFERLSSKDTATMPFSTAVAARAFGRSMIDMGCSLAECVGNPLLLPRAATATHPHRVLSRPPRSCGMAVPQLSGSPGQARR